MISGGNATDSTATRTHPPNRPTAHGAESRRTEGADVWAPIELHFKLCDALGLLAIRRYKTGIRIGIREGRMKSKLIKYLVSG